MKNINVISCGKFKVFFLTHRIGDLFSVGNLFHWLLDFFMNIKIAK